MWGGSGGNGIHYWQIAHLYLGIIIATIINCQTFNNNNNNMYEPFGDIVCFAKFFFSACVVVAVAAVGLQRNHLQKTLQWIHYYKPFPSFCFFSFFMSFFLLFFTSHSVSLWVCERACIIFLYFCKSANSAHTYTHTEREREKKRKIEYMKVHLYGICH